MIRQPAPPSRRLKPPPAAWVAVPAALCLAWAVGIGSADDPLPAGTEHAEAERADEQQAGQVAEPRAPLSAELLESLIAELDDERFVIRENATRALVHAGPEGLDLLAEAADGVRPEAAARAVQVLLAKSRVEDGAEALAALERLAALSNWPAQRRAAQDRLDAMAERVAIREVQRLGGLARQFDTNHNSDPVIVHLHLGDGWRGTEDDFQHVARLKSLQLLTIYYVELGDEALLLLAELPNLRQVQLYGTNASDEGVGRLRARLPQTEIEHRRGALLGVRGTVLPGVAGGAVVDQVQPDTAAERAGLRSGDRVVAFNDQPVADFPALTAHISQYKPGDKARLTVVRHEERFETEVEFGRWRVDQFER